MILYYNREEFSKSHIFLFLFIIKDRKDKDAASCSFLRCWPSCPDSYKAVVGDEGGYVQEALAYFLSSLGNVVGDGPQSQIAFNSQTWDLVYGAGTAVTSHLKVNPSWKQDYTNPVCTHKYVHLDKKVIEHQ